MKCEGFFNKEDFVSNVRLDFVKVEGNVKPTFKPSRMWVLAFSANEKIYDKMRKSKDPEPDHVILYPLAGVKDVELTAEEKATKPKIVLWIFERERITGEKKSSIGTRPTDGDEDDQPPRNKPKGGKAAKKGPAVRSLAVRSKPVVDEEDSDEVDGDEVSADGATEDEEDEEASDNGKVGKEGTEDEDDDEEEEDDDDE